MQFTELSYQMQLKVLDRFGEAMLKEQDEFLQLAMASAIVELELWCNAPIVEREQDLSSLNKETPVDPNFKPSREFIEALKGAGARESWVKELEKPYVAQAADPEDE
jgi:hypothetical protein